MIWSQLSSSTASWATWQFSQIGIQTQFTPVRMWCGTGLNRLSLPSGVWSHMLLSLESTTIEASESFTWTMSCIWNCGLYSQKYAEIFGVFTHLFFLNCVYELFILWYADLRVGWQHSRHSLDSEDLPGRHQTVHSRASKLLWHKNHFHSKQVTLTINSSLWHP